VQGTLTKLFDRAIDKQMDIEIPEMLQIQKSVDEIQEKCSNFSDYTGYIRNWVGG